MERCWNKQHQTKNIFATWCCCCCLSLLHHQTLHEGWAAQHQAMTSLSRSSKPARPTKIQVMLDIPWSVKKDSCNLSFMIIYAISWGLSRICEDISCPLFLKVIDQWSSNWELMTSRHSNSILLPWLYHIRTRELRHKMTTAQGEASRSHITSIEMGLFSELVAK